MEQSKVFEFFCQVKQAFDSAVQNGNPIYERRYEIGGYSIRLCFAGEALIPLLTPALQHLNTSPSTNHDLTIFVWDSQSTGSSMPSPPWSEEDFIARGDVRGLHDPRFQTAFHRGSGVFNLLDREHNIAFYWIQDAESLPYYESGAPFRTILHWWMRENQRQFVHAAAVGNKNGGVLLAGKGGSGKSSTALACLSSPLFYLSDDYCLLSIEVEPTVYSLYNTAKLDPGNLGRFKHLQTLISNTERLSTEKALIFLYKYCPEKITNKLPLKAIFLPRVTGEIETTLSPISPIEGLKAIAPSTIFQLSGAGRDEFNFLARFSRQLPSYLLALGTDIEQIPEVISRFLAEAS